MNDNTGDAQIETQIHVNKYITVIIIPVIVIIWFSIACYLKEKRIIICFDSLYTKNTKIKVNVLFIYYIIYHSYCSYHLSLYHLSYIRVIFIISSILNKIEVSDWLLLQPLNIPKQADANSCGIHVILNLWFLLQLGDTCNQVDIVNSRI